MVLQASHLLTLARALQLVLVCTPLLALSPFAYRSERHRERWFALLASTLESCGPIHVKLGQWASSRLDIFPHRLCQGRTMDIFEPVRFQQHRNLPDFN